MAKKKNYYDPSGALTQGWLGDDGKMYKDEALTQRIDKGSRVQMDSGNVYRMGDYGGELIYSPTQYDKKGNWVAAGNPYYRQQMALMEQLQDRQPYKFDLDASALYQAIKDNTIRQGQRAMQDTMGQAAALTGGYGSSYAQGAGQQAYNDFLTRLNEQIPQIAAQERAAYDADTDRLYQQLQLAGQMYGQQYSEAMAERDWQHQLGREAVGDAQWQQQFDYTKTQDALAEAWRQKQWDADMAQQALENTWTERNWQHTLDREAVGDAQWQQQFEQNKLQDALAEAWRQKQWDADMAQQALENSWTERDWTAQQEDSAYSRAMNMVDMALSYGFDPDDSALAAAGLTRSQYNTAKAFVSAQRAAARSSGSGSGGGDTPKPSPEVQLKTVPTDTLNKLANAYVRAEGDVGAVATDLQTLQNQGYDTDAAFDYIKEHYAQIKVAQARNNQNKPGMIPRYTK